MNPTIIKIISGHTLLTMLAKINTSADDKCLFIEKNKIKTIECSNLRLGTFPNDLDEQSKVINLTSTKIGILYSESLKRYSNLEILIMNKTIVNNLEGLGLLQSLKKLHTLIMDSVQMTNTNKLFWPPNIEILTLRKLNLTEFDVSKQFPRLKQIILSDNNFSKFPNLNPESPLETINLNEMAMIIDALDIVPYCRLKNLQANWVFRNDRRLTNQVLCQCKRLIDWLLHHDINHNFQCPNYQINDGNYCDLTIPEGAMLVYEKCLEKLSKSRSVQLENYVIALTIFFSAFILSAILFYYLVKVTVSFIESFGANYEETEIED